MTLNMDQTRQLDLTFINRRTSRVGFAHHIQEQGTRHAMVGKAHPTSVPFPQRTPEDPG